jgi:CubicO group peptidase (beta-lactamase class C family)
MKIMTRLTCILTLGACMVTMSMSQAFALNSTFDGNWRGELVLPGSIKLAIGIEISAKHSALTISSPNQGMHNREPTTFSISGNTVSFTDEGLKASFEGTIDGNTLTGTFTQGQARPLVLKKLLSADLKRMKFEGKYVGDLQINKNATLPLVLHVAVIPDGFSAMLDSPSQNSFGIPINEINLDMNTLTFTSSLLGAKFEGNAPEADTNSDMTYTGVFIQGMPLPLTLSKVGADNAHLQFEPPKFGDKGGSAAVVSAAGVETRYWREHTQNSQYEIGSITKTFVSLLLAQQVVDDTLDLSTTIDNYFLNAPALSMLDLATHTSGLERLMPSIHNNVDPANPYAHITRALLQSDLANMAEQVQSVSNEHLYSNFGYAALGEALAMHANKSLFALMQNKVFEPLSMQSSYLSVAPKQASASLVQGHNNAGTRVPAWSLGAASGAGAIVSTLGDMVTYAEFMMSLSTEYPDLAALLFASYGPTGSCCQQGLAWVLMEDDNGKTYAWHNGMTGGFSAFIGFYLDGSKAVVMLNNQAASFDNTAHALLTDNIALQSI